MDKQIQEQLDTQVKARRAVEVVEASEVPLLSLDLLERDRRETDTVEINLRDQRAWVVESSDAPELTAEVLAVRGKPLQTVEIFFDGELLSVRVREGRPLSVEVACARLAESYQDRTLDAECMHEQDRASKELLVSAMVVEPLFSQKGQGEGYPIESCSPLLLDVLFEAYLAVNERSEDEIYQVSVLRGRPLEAMLLSEKTFELYPAPIQTNLKDMSDAEIEALEASNRAQKRVSVASLVRSPVFSYQGEGDGFPVENISEAVLDTLYEAYRVVNIPEAGYQALRRFLRVGDRNSSRADTDSEPVDEQLGGGEAALGTSLS